MFCKIVAGTCQHIKSVALLVGSVLEVTAKNSKRHLLTFILKSLGSYEDLHGWG